MTARHLLAALVLFTSLAALAAEPAPKMEFESYQLVLLVRAADPPKLSDEESAKLQEAHLGHLRKMFEAGKAVVAGPFDNQDDAGKRGMCLYRVATPQEARALAEQDPAVKAGRLEVEVMTWFVEKGAIAFPMAEALPKK